MRESMVALDLLSHLARMQSAGLPWMEALTLWRDTCRKPAQRQAVERLMGHLRRGLGLTQALAREGWIHGPLQALSQAAETSGTWADQIDAWLSQTRQTQRLQRQLRSALAYPTLVLSLAVLVMAGVMQWVLPVFEGLYAHLPTTLPWATRALLGWRDAWNRLGQVPWLVLAMCWGAMEVARRQPRWRLPLELTGWRLPIWGRWRQMHLEARWCGLLTRLLQAGLDWSSALRLTGPAMGSAVFDQSCRLTLATLQRGLGPADALVLVNRRWRRRCGRDVHSPALIQWMRAAEATGTLPDALQSWSRSQAEALLVQCELALRLLEPALMTLLGLLMGWLVLALYLPVMDMGQWL
ncbi:MAG: hypothetical protein RL657_2743 [Pseudomonadota bacterium]